MYDSMRTGDVPTTTKKAIASLLNSPRQLICLHFPEVTQQQGGCECGLFALAYAYTLCSGGDPCRLYYIQKDFRKHFKACIDCKQLKPFPSNVLIDNPRPPIKSTFRVYCTCRLPDTGDQCMLCRAWFHFTCVGLEAGHKVKGLWLCMKCDKS